MSTQLLFSDGITTGSGNAGWMTGTGASGTGNTAGCWTIGALQPRKISNCFHLNIIAVLVTSRIVKRYNILMEHTKAQTMCKHDVPKSNI